jgi:hypothetical protein
MDRRTAGCIRWASPGLFLTKTAGQCMMKAGWMRFAQSGGMMRNKNREKAFSIDDFRNISILGSG